jgi:hypothetical protein
MQVRASDRLLQLVGVRFCLWFLIAGSLLPGVLEAPHQLTPHYDDHYFHAHEEAARIALSQYHQLPAWNPYYCGGIPLAANPQDETFAPDFLLRLAFGTSLGRHLAVLLFVVLGLEGAYRLARKQEASTIAAFVAAIAFACSGRFFVMLEYGWIHMFGFQLLPLAILAYENGFQSWRWRLFGGAMVGWMLLCGGTYTVPYSVAVLGLLALYDSALLFFKPDERGWYRPLLSAATIGLAAGVLSAAKLLPMMRVISEHPRMVSGREAFAMANVLEMLVVFKRNASTLAGESYIGEGILILALMGAIVRGHRAGRSLFCAIIFFGLSLGDVGPGALFSLLRKLPIYEQLRNPERFTVVVGLFFTLAAAQALTWLEDLLPRLALVVRDRFRAFRARRRKLEVPPSSPLDVRARFVFGLLGAGIALVVGFPLARMVVRHSYVSQGLFSQEPVLAHAAPFRQARGNRWDAQVWPPASMGTLQCFEETEFPQSAKLRGDLAAEEYGADPAIKVERVKWTPNAITLHVSASSPGTVLVNQNYDSGWRSSEGQTRSADGLLAVDVGPGEHTVDLVYRDWLVIIGLLMTVLAWSFLVYLFGRWLQQRWRVLTATSST